MTGALVRVGQGLVAAAFGETPRFGWLPDALLWVGLLVGAAGGAALFPLFGLGGIVIAAAVVLLAAFWTSLDRRAA